jgi:hypothetical protein
MKPFVCYGIFSALAMIGGFFCLITGIARLKKESKFFAIGLIIISIPLFYAAYALSVKSDQLKGVTPKSEQSSTK